MSKNLSATYYQENKERLQKQARERYQNLSKKKNNKKTNNMVVNVTKISQMKNKRLLSIETNIIEGEKTLNYKCKNFNLENFASS